MMFRIFNRTKPYFDLSGEEFARAYNACENPVLLDVRTPQEFAMGRIPGAINIDITRGDFKTLVDNFDKEKVYFVYCRGGNRSVAACSILGKNGFRSYNLVTGIIDWKGDFEGTYE